MYIKAVRNSVAASFTPWPKMKEKVLHETVS